MSCMNGCTTNGVDVPPLAGPSEFALSVTLTATPDLLPADGTSQAEIGIFVRDAAGQPVPNQQLRVTSNLGALTAATVSTGSNGRTSVRYTAPHLMLPADGATETITVTPYGTNAANSLDRAVFIRLVPPATISAAGSPIANFTFSPAAPKIGTLVVFDASSSVDSDGTIVSYRWDWGDGETAVGKTEDHDYFTARDYFVTLTVTDNSGLASSATKRVTVIP